MKPRPAPRPSPRTLAAQPPTPQRAPHATAYEARFPALAALVAGASLAAGCHDPQCGEDRGDELETHGREALERARAGAGGDAIRALGVALGLRAHTTTRVPDPGRTAGVAVPVETMPVPPPPPQQELPVGVEGGVRPVTQTPPTPPPPVPTTRPTRRPAQHPTATPSTRPPTTAGAPMPVTAVPPNGERHTLGDFKAVGPTPPRDPRA